MMAKPQVETVDTEQSVESVYVITLETPEPELKDEIESNDEEGVCLEA